MPPKGSKVVKKVETKTETTTEEVVLGKRTSGRNKEVKSQETPDIPAAKKTKAVA